MKNVDIFESVTAKRTFCVKQFFFGQKLSSKEPLQKPRVQPLLFSLLFLSSISFFFPFPFFSVLLQLIGPKSLPFDAFSLK